MNLKCIATKNENYELIFALNRPKKMSSQSFFSNEIDKFFDARQANRVNEECIEGAFHALIDKSKEYRESNKKLTEKNRLLRRATRKFHASAMDARKKNEQLQQQTDALERNLENVRQHLSIARQKYQELLRRIKTVVNDAEMDQFIESIEKIGSNDAVTTFK